MISPFQRLIVYYKGLADDMFQLKVQYSGDLKKAEVINNAQLLLDYKRIIQELNSIEIMHKEAVQYWVEVEKEWNLKRKY